MTREPGLLWVAGNATIVTEAQSLMRMGPELLQLGLPAKFVGFEEATTEPIDGLLVVDARDGIQRAIRLLRQVGPQQSRDAIIIAHPLQPFDYRTIRGVGKGIVLYDPIDVTDLSAVMEIMLSRRKAS